MEIHILSYVIATNKYKKCNIFMISSSIYLNLSNKYPIIDHALLIKDHIQYHNTSRTI